MLNFSSVVRIPREYTTRMHFNSTSTVPDIWRVFGDYTWGTTAVSGFWDVPEWAVSASGQSDKKWFAVAPLLLYRTGEKEPIRMALEPEASVIDFSATYTPSGSPSVVATSGKDVELAPSMHSESKFRQYRDLAGQTSLEEGIHITTSFDYRYGAYDFPLSDARVATTGCAFHWISQSKKTTYVPDQSVSATCGVVNNPTFTCLPCILTLFFGPYAEDAIPSEFSACIQLRSASTSQTCSTSPASSRSRAPQ